MGDIPPPVHGMAAINKALLERCQERGLVCFINTAPSALASCFNSKLWLLIKVLFFFPVTTRLLWALLRRKERVFYRSLNGGVGQVFDVCWLLLARLAGADIFLHHHASSYLSKPTGLFKVLRRVAGPSAIHIVLGKAMEKSLTTLHNVAADKIRVLSNAAFFSSPEASEVPTKPAPHIGYLANLSIPKGLDIFLELVRVLHRKKIPFTASVAGPCADAKLKSVLSKAVIDVPSLTWIGPVYGQEKRDFLSAVDVFVYPSRNEAEPLVLYEAAQSGALLVGSQSGCMHDMITRLAGFSLSLENPSEWVSWAVEIIATEKVEFAKKNARKARFHFLMSESKHDLEKLMDEFFHATSR